MPISLRSILTLSYLLLGLPKGFFPVDLPVKILKALLPSSILAYYNGLPSTSNIGIQLFGIVSNALPRLRFTYNLCSDKSLPTNHNKQLIANIQ